MKSIGTEEQYPEGTDFQGKKGQRRSVLKRKKSSHKNWLPKTQINKVTYMFSQLTMGVMLIRGVNVHFTTRDVQSCDAGAVALLSPAHVLGAGGCTVLWTEGAMYNL